MKRRQRTEILINSTSDLLALLSKQIEDRYETTVTQDPNPGLVMVKVRETAAQSLFYLGEVLVTECKVQINDATGIGLIQGDESKKAYHLAVIDAAYTAGLTETSGWEALLQLESEKLASDRKKDVLKLMGTKVDFETMDND
ncbi:phosphonate C-P lyase system protein PhnG [Paenibacillus sp. Marseille-Q4541]|uniref:phosphonate C-P lyase system protein PhnG n=1 Tax=Paenibacillus sp. Marseille-Q4541 TaxID=2831522 RepID=UPI001BAE3407|nr:phosphonate C-P lyase system protein PhnG [Paenibacillus sp. Marseille-Q4541]